MKAIGFVVRSPAGVSERGSIPAAEASAAIASGAGHDISLNLSQADLRGYTRVGSDLHVALADGRVIVLTNYFDAGGTPQGKVYLSSDGAIFEVAFEDGSDGVLFATYGEPQIWGKWTPVDELIFFDRPEVMVADAGTVVAGGNDVSMLGAGLLGGGGLMNLLGLGGAAAGAAVLGGGGGGGSEPDAPAAPAIVSPDGPVVVGGPDDQTVTVTGTGEPGATVVVTVGDEEVTTTIDENGDWVGIFEGETFPGDGDHEVTVVVTNPDGSTVTLEGNTVTIDTTPPVSVATEGTGSVGHVVNADDHSDGVTISGTGEAGSTVVVTVQDHSETTTVGSDGTWTVTFAPGTITTGEYETEVTVTSTDGMGNSATITDTLVIDTVAPDLTVASDSVEGDGTINATELADGFALTGTAEAGATVSVTLGGVTQVVTAGGDGSWSLDWSSTVLAPGEYDAEVTATATDAAGNTTTTSTTIRVDTIGSVTISTTAIEGDDIVNATEASDGFAVSGTAEPGSTVTVGFGGASWAATVAADGSWTATVPASAIAAGTYDATITVNATDAAGNTSSDSRTIRVDTETSAGINSGLSGGDDLVNAEEATGGLAITGTAEPGASVVVGFAGGSYTATAGASGTWSVTVPAGDIAPGTYDAPITATVTDTAGNTATATSTVRVDTTSSVSVETATVEGDGIVNAAERADGVTLTGTAEPGSSVQVTMGAVTRNATVAGDGSWTATFPAGAVPTGESSVTVTAVATDGAGNTSTATGSIAVDTLVRDFALGDMPGGADEIVNAVEHGAGATLSGQVEPGSTVMVTLGSVTRPATVGANGAWTVNFGPGDIPTGEYTTVLTAVATDAAGNSSTLTDLVRIDTEAGRLTISPAPVEGDDIVNAAEAADGVAITGTADPGASVTVTLAGATTVVTANAAGIWTAQFAPGQIAAGTYDAQITASITDIAGNSRTVTDSVRIDTGVDNFGVTNAPTATDDMINGAGRDAGYTLSGTTEPGSTVQVTLGGVTRSATVDGSGNWTVYFAPGDIAQGEYDATLTVTTTDIAGNTASADATVRVDTLVNTLDITGAPAVVNAQAAAAGVTLTGEVEPGSTVTVTVAGTTYTATVDAGGNWSINVPAGALPGGEYDTTVTVNATDAAGNTDTTSQVVHIDTVAPDSTLVEAVNFDRSGDIRDISVEQSGDTLTVGHVQANGSITDLGYTATPIGGETNVLFDTTVPDGSHLVVARTDDAGNTTGTYLVVNESGTSSVSAANPNLGAFEIEAIDLSFAENSSLTITEAQLLALSGNSDQVVVYGGGDDSVTISGATLSGSTTNASGVTFNVYSLGTEGTVLIEDDITSVVT